jgi:abortive infection bacteriophage resistance protein
MSGVDNLFNGIFPCLMFAYVRNLSAHHLRLWNRTFLFTPLIAGFEKEFYISSTQKQDLSSLYVRTAIIQILMQKIAPESKWGENLKGLIAEHSSVSVTSLGCPAGWEKQAIWNK